MLFPLRFFYNHPGGRTWTSKTKPGRQLNGLERILHKIPGFKGYLRKGIAPRFRPPAARVHRQAAAPGEDRPERGAAGRQPPEGLRTPAGSTTCSPRHWIPASARSAMPTRATAASSTCSRSGRPNWTGYTSWTRRSSKRRLLSATEFKKLAAAPLEAPRLDPLREELERIDAMFAAEDRPAERVSQKEIST